MKAITLINISLFSCILFACNNPEKDVAEEKTNPVTEILLQAEDFKVASFEVEQESLTILLSKNQWLAYELNVNEAGRYKVEVNALAQNKSIVWIEDYYDNSDNRTYDITGKIKFDASDQFQKGFKDGSPLNVGIHKIKIHVSEGIANIDWIKFTRIQDHINTKVIFEQKMSGNEWNLVWSDEFDGAGLPDTSKWSYNIGNWGWGNNEPQYYTQFRTENARLENGNLIIEARKNDMGQAWTSTRLTTQGKESFLYGKIEFRAKVPTGRGTWAAGWLLGDEYRDEISWPYCGEIDVLECVGFEINDSTGNGKNHATCHTRSYYFKQGNQIGADIDVKSMNSKFHTYSIEWYPDVIYGLLDGERFYTYDKNKNELEWPFHKPQNIILNLAIGGGWGGAKGLDENWDNHQYIIDYVRVYELK